MRWNALFLLFLSFSCFGQENTDSIAPPIEEPEWSSKNYTQEDKIYNRSVWTFIDNPALVGFDRKLNISYKYVAEKMALGYYREKDNLPIFFFQQHFASIDAAFGGKRKNWGVGVAYNWAREGNLAHHLITWCHSYRILMPKGHQLIFGHGLGIWSSINLWDNLTFGDMIDPRYGFVYQTNEVPPNSRVSGWSPNFGLRYIWKRLAFDYTFQAGPDGLYSFSGAPDTQLFHQLKLLYHFYLGDEITLSPEFLLRNNRVDVWRLNPIVSITYQDMLYGQIGFFDYNRLQLKIGYQFKDHFTIEVGASAYSDQTIAAVTGVATAEAGIRYQLSRRKR